MTNKRFYAKYDLYCCQINLKKHVCVPSPHAYAQTQWCHLVSPHVTRWKLFF